MGDSKRVPGGISTVNGTIYNGGWGQETGNEDGHNPNIGRYPGNLIVSSDDEVERCFPVTGPAKISYRNPNGKYNTNAFGDFNGQPGVASGYEDAGGSASRFFQHCDYSIEEIAELNGIEARRIVYCGKASQRDRDEGCEGMEERDSALNFGGKLSGNGKPINIDPRHNHHPTCKPSSLLRYCLKLICPPGATVIDPFFGSGSTGKAALLEGFRVIGIEREPEYFDIAIARCAHVSPDTYTVQPTVGKVAAVAAQGVLL